MESDWVTLPDGAVIHSHGLGERLAGMTNEERAEHMTALQELTQAIDRHWDEL